MKFILAIIVTLLFSYFLRKSIKKHAVYYYIGALIIALFTIFVSPSMMPSPVATVRSTFFEYGTVSTAMLSLVMYMNAFKNGSKIQKTFMPIRAELSIIACILTYGHNFYTAKTYVKMFFTYPEKMSSMTKLALLFTLVLVLLMTPLFITSFKKVRKKMKAKNWKKLQQSAYVFYMLIYVHVMLLMLPMALMGSVTYIINVVVYSAVFLTYGTLRLYKYYKKSKKPIAIVLITSMYICLAGVLAFNLIDFSEEVEEIEIEETLDTEEDTEDNIEEETDIVYEETEEELTEEEIEEEIEDEPSKYDIDLSVIPDGEYTGQAEGYSGIVTVTVTMESGVITGITLDSHSDDQTYMDKATWIRKYMMDDQTIDIDVVTNATFSSIGIKDAVLDALTIEE